jgi:hypothetical protein
MKRFFKLSWKGIPIGIIATVLLCTVVVAAVWVTTTLTITQEIKEPYVPPEEVYGSITAPDIDLSQVAPNSSFSQTLTGAVVVELGPDGEGKAMRMVCTADEKYTSFGGTITLKERPADSTVGLYGYGITGGGAAVAIDLDVRGTYIFDLTVEGKAGSEAGSASSTITFTLEDSTTPAK